MPGTFVGISSSVPRTSIGAFGFGSNESMCGTTPAIHKNRTDFAFNRRVAVAGEAHDCFSNSAGRAAAAMLSDPTRNMSRRETSDPMEGASGTAGRSVIVAHPGGKFGERGTGDYR